MKICIITIKSGSSDGLVFTFGYMIYMIAFDYSHYSAKHK